MRADTTFGTSELNSGIQTGSRWMSKTEKDKWIQNTKFHGQSIVKINPLHAEFVFAVREYWCCSDALWYAQNESVWTPQVRWKMIKLSNTTNIHIYFTYLTRIHTTLTNNFCIEFHLCAPHHQAQHAQLHLYSCWGFWMESSWHIFAHFWCELTFYQWQCAKKGQIRIYSIN